MLYFEHSGYGYSKRLCEDVVCWFISNHLPRHKLDIEIFHRGLKREGVLGWCDVLENSYRPRNFLIEIDTYMDKKTYATVLLHELYHVLQWVKGDLKIKSSKMHYKNRCVEDLEYWERPHEILAHWNEKILLQKYLKDKCLTHL